MENRSVPKTTLTGRVAQVIGFGEVASGDILFRNFSSETIYIIFSTDQNALRIVEGEINAGTTGGIFSFKKRGMHVSVGAIVMRSGQSPSPIPARTAIMHVTVMTKKSKNKYRIFRDNRPIRRGSPYDIYDAMLKDDFGIVNYEDF